MKATPTITQAQLDRELSRYAKAPVTVPDIVPRHMMTARAWARRWDLSDSHTRRHLANLVIAGKFVGRKYRVRTIGQLYPVPHYGPVSLDRKPTPRPIKAA